MTRHGDLRNACVARGLSLLESSGRSGRSGRTEGSGRTGGSRRGGTSGLAAVSLREIARDLGVSPRAPYRHFADKSALLAAMAGEGFARFGAALAASRAARPGGRRSPRRRLQALGAAYIDFAVEHPHLVALMFGDAFPDRARRFPALDQAALATFALLTDAVREALEATGSGGRRRARATSLTAFSAWALVHGIADLVRHGQLAAVLPRVERAALERFAVQLLLRA